jgi:hypothetical protein
MWTLRCVARKGCSAQPISRFLSSRRSGDHLSVRSVTSRIQQHTRCFLRDGPPQCTCLALLPVGFAWPWTLLPTPVVSYTAVSPSPHLRRAIHLSVALAVGSPRLAVSQHRTLWRADFPPCPRGAARSPSQAEHAPIIQPASSTVAAQPVGQPPVATPPLRA